MTDPVPAKQMACGCCGQYWSMTMGPCPNTADGLHTWDFRTDQVPEITALQNRVDEAELRAMYQYQDNIVKDLRIQVAQLQVMVCELKRDFVPYGRSIRWLAIGITACLVIIVKLLFW